MRIRPVCKSRRVRRAPGTGTVKLEKPASRTTPSSAEVVSACWRGMRIGAAGWRDCWVMVALACGGGFAVPFDGADCGCADAGLESDWLCGGNGAPRNADAAHAAKQHSTPSERRIRRGEIPTMCQNTERPPEILPPNGQRPPRNCYYITILGTPEQQFSTVNLYTLYTGSSAVWISARPVRENH